jgi:hypothetical protein
MLQGGRDRPTRPSSQSTQAAFHILAGEAVNQ